MCVITQTKTKNGLFVCNSKTKNRTTYHRKKGCYFSHPVFKFGEKKNKARENNIG